VRSLELITESQVYSIQ